MNVELTVPEGLRERVGVDSQVLVKNGFPPLGIIFTTSDNPSEKDFDPAQLLGATLEDIDRRSETENRFHKIIGGYFFTPKAAPNPRDPGNGTTTQVFGIALEAFVGITEGGGTVIFDGFRDLDGTRRFINENRPIANQDTGEKGWTFITEPIFGDDVYPRSRRPLGFVRVCPEIDSIDKILAIPAATEQKVSFIANIIGGDFERLKWDFGDGTTDESKTNEISHTYQRIEGETKTFDVNVELIGFDGCRDKGHVTVKIPGIECPVIESLELKAEEPSKKTLKVSATITIKGSPDSVTIDWGDGSPTEDASSGSVDHEYTRPVGDDKKFIVTVSTAGPATCAAQASAAVLVPGICPKIEKLVVEDVSHEDYTQKVKITAVMVDGLLADKFIWDFGDGSAPESTTEPHITHIYQKAKEDKVYKLALYTEGPGSCRDQAGVDVKIDKGLCCPIIQKVSYKKDPAQNGKVKVHAEIQWDEGTPSKIDIDWGDGTVAKDINSTTASHEYDEPDGIYAVYDIVATLHGPGDCWSNYKEKIYIPAKSCGKLKAVKVTVQNTSTSEQAVSASLDLEGSFEKYTFDWGDGTVDGPISSPTATHVYSRATQDRTYNVRVTALGPGPCDGGADTKHSVPAKEKVIPPVVTPEKESILCRYLPYIVAFLSALSLGHLALLITALNTTGTDTGIAWGAAISSVILLIIAIIVWYRFCKPTRCNWLAVGWVTFLGAALPIFNSLDCAGEEVLIPTLISFVIGGVFGFFWFRNCSPKSKSQVFLIYFGLLVLAGLIAGLLTTKAVMNC